MTDASLQTVGGWEIIRLCLGLLLPWVTGSLVFALLARLAGKSNHAAFTVGAGYLLGWVVLWLLLLAFQAAGMPLRFWPPVFALALIAATLAALLNSAAITKPARPPVIAPDAGTQYSIRGIIVAGLLAVLLALHLWFIWREVSYAPAFGWDAIQTWLYRAKVWFFHQEMVGLVSFADWLQHPGDHYAMPGHQYPPLPSLAAMWVAVSLGHWHEVLINWPGFLAGIAALLVLYGGCREAGLGRPLSLTGVYLLVSLPMMGTHMAAGGYADIWMAGFFGAGYLVCLQAVWTRNPRWLVTGFIILAAGLLVKQEMAAWLLFSGITAGLLWFGSRKATLLSLLFSAAAIALVLLANVDVEIPWLGRFAITDQALITPFTPPLRLEIQPVWGSLALQFFWMDNWHLLPLAVVAAGVAAATCRDIPQRASILATLGLVVAAFVVLFALTPAGRWAESGTAVNRLGLHFAIPLLLVCVLTLHGRLERENRQTVAPGTTGRLAGRLALMFAIITGASLVASLNQGLLFPRGQETVQFHASQPTVIRGRAAVEGGILLVSGFTDGTAIVSWPTALAAKDRPIFHIRLSAQGASDRGTLFWRTAENSAQIHILDFPLNTDGRVDLRASDAWRGDIIEIGLQLYGNSQAAYRLATIALPAPGPGLLARHLGQQWSQRAAVSLANINMAYREDGRQLPSLTAVVFAMCAAAILVYALFSMRTRRWAFAGFLVPVVLCGWLLLDLRWLASMAEDPRDQSVDVYRINRELSAWAGTLRQELEAETGSTMLMVGDDIERNYLALAMRYHLLPMNVSLHANRVVPEELERLDYVAAHAAEGTDVAQQRVAWDKLGFVNPLLMRHVYQDEKLLIMAATKSRTSD